MVSLDGDPLFANNAPDGKMGICIDNKNPPKISNSFRYFLHVATK